MKRGKTWQPYDAQGRRMPPPFAPREPAPYDVIDGVVYDWDHEDLHWDGRQAEGFLTRHEDACVRAVLQGVQFCDLEAATSLPGSIVGPIVTAPWFLAVVHDRQAISFERGRAMLSQAYPDAVRYLYEVMSGMPELDEHGQPIRDKDDQVVRPPRADRMRAAETLVRLGPQAEAQGVIARRVDALRRSLQQEAGTLARDPAEQTAELVQKYLPAVLAKKKEAASESENGTVD